jgi:ABC-type transport system involved in cytochrome c biogenesis permease component
MVIVQPRKNSFSLYTDLQTRMTFLPIVERELRVRARQTRTYWTRFAVGLCGAFICVLELRVPIMSGGAATTGGYAFQGLVIAAFFICCGGCLVTADAISRERREGTLGLLFLTGVRGPDVVLGKLTSAAMTNVLALVAFLPVLMIPVLSGGVTGGEAFRIGLMLLNTLFLALAVGLWASTRATELFKTIRKALVMLLAILVVPAVIDRWLLHGGPMPHIIIGRLSPLVGMTAAGDTMYRASPGTLWTSLVLIHTMAWGFVAWAAIHLRKSLLLDGDAVGGSRGVRRSNRELLTGLSAPVNWLVNQQKGVRAMVWLAAAVSLLSFGWRYLFPLFYTSSRRMWTAAVMGPLSLAQSVVTASLVAWAASRFFFEARRTGVLELLITTPVGAKTIVSAQLNALWRIVRWPLVVMILPLCFQVVTLWMQLGRQLSTPWLVPYTFSTLFALINMILDVLVLCWVGMWYGAQAQTQTTAIVRTVLWARVVPLCLSLVISFVFSMTPVRFRSTFLPSLVLFSVPQVVITVYYLWLLKWVRARLQGELRDAEPIWGGSPADASAIWKRGLRRLQDVRHWTPIDSK